MKQYKHLLFILPVILMSSCMSSLKVQVDSLDMEKMRKSNQYQRPLLEAELQDYNVKLNSNYFEVLRTKSLEAVEKALGSADDFDSTNWLASTMLVIDSSSEVAFQDIKEKAQEVRDALADFLKNEDSLLRVSYIAAQSRYLVSKQLLINYLKELADQAEVPIEDRKVYINFVTGVELSLLPKGIYGTPITDDRMASFVAKAPEDFWRRYNANFYRDENDLSKSKKNAQINKTQIRTFIGNSDIAIKMDNPGSFVIKGVRLDADQAFRASFKVLSQGIQYFAAANMIPAGNSGTGTATEDINVAELANLEANKQLATSLESEHDKLTNTFLSVVATYQEDLKKSPAKRKAALIAIKQAYAYYKSQLTTQ